MTEQAPLYDLSAFREMDAEDPGALVQIVNVFIASTPGVINDLNNAYKESNMVGLASTAHKLKATVDILSIGPLKGVIRQIESIGKTGEGLQELSSLMELLNTTMDEVISRIKAEIS